jgi:hypothetical protein
MGIEEMDRFLIPTQTFSLRLPPTHFSNEIQSLVEELSAIKLEFQFLYYTKPINYQSIIQGLRTMRVKLKSNSPRIKNNSLLLMHTTYVS